MTVKAVLKRRPKVALAYAGINIEPKGPAIRTVPISLSAQAMGNLWVCSIVEGLGHSL